MPAKLKKIDRTGKEPATDTCTMCETTKLITKREISSQLCTECHEQMATPKEQGGIADVAKKETGGEPNDTGKGTGTDKTSKPNDGTGIPKGDEPTPIEHREGELP